MLALLALALAIAVVAGAAGEAADEVALNLDDLRAFNAMSQSLARASWRDCNVTGVDPCSVCSGQSPLTAAVICETFAYNVTILANATSSTNANSTANSNNNLRPSVQYVKQERYERRIVGLRFRNLAIRGEVPVLALRAFYHLRELNLANERNALFPNLITMAPVHGAAAAAAVVAVGAETAGGDADNEACVTIARCYNNDAVCDLGALAPLCTRAPPAMGPGAFAGAIIGGTLGVLALVLAISFAFKRRYFKHAEDEATRRARQEKKNRSISNKQRKALEKERLRQEKIQKKLAEAKRRKSLRAAAYTGGGPQIVKSNARAPNKQPRNNLGDGQFDTQSVHSARSNARPELASAASFRSGLNAPPPQQPPPQRRSDLSTKSKKKTLQSRASFRSKAGGEAKKLVKQKSVYSSLRTRTARAGNNAAPIAAVSASNSPWVERRDNNGVLFWVNPSTGQVSSTPPRDAFSKTPTYQSQLAAAANSRPQSNHYDDLDEPNYYANSAPYSSSHMMMHQGAPGGFGGGMSQNPLFQG